MTLFEKKIISMVKDYHAYLSGDSPHLPEYAIARGLRLEVNLTYTKAKFHMTVEVCSDYARDSIYSRPKGLRTTASKATRSNSQLSMDFWVEFTALLKKLSR